MASIANARDFLTALNNRYAWPGGYPTYFLAADGASICHRCAKENLDAIREAIALRDNDQWRIVYHAINWEDKTLACAHCNELIESAYASDETHKPSYS